MVKKILAFLLAGTLAAATAQAGQKYVGHGFTSDNNLGTSAVASWSSIQHALGEASADDTVWVYPGQYSAEDLTTTNQPVSIFGTTDGLTVADAATGGVVINSSVNITSPYTKFAGFLVTGDMSTAEAADFSFIHDNIVRGSLYVDGTDYTTFLRNTYQGPFWHVGREKAVDRDTFSTNTFTNLGGTTDGVNYPTYFGLSQTVGDDSMAIIFNDITCNVQSHCPPCQEYWPIYFKHTTNLSLRGNHWHGTVVAGMDWAFRTRDKCYNWTVDCDTFTITGNGATTFWLSSHGNDGDEPIHNLWIDSTLVNGIACTGGGQAQFAFSGDHNKLTYSTFAMPQTAMRIPSGERDTIDHCTLVATGTTAYSDTTVAGRHYDCFDDLNGILHGTRPGGQGVIKVGDDAGTALCLHDTSLVLTNNIIALLGPQLIHQPITGYGTSDGCKPERIGIYYEYARLDSGHVGRYQKNVYAHHNLYSYYGYAQNPGDRSIYIHGYGDNNLTNGAPGDNTPTENAFGLDSVGTYGSPQFKDSSWTSFDAHLRVGSAAIGHSSTGGDIGAVASVNYPIAQVSPQIAYFVPGDTSSVSFYITNIGGDSLGLASCGYTQINQPILYDADDFTHYGFGLGGSYTPDGDETCFKIGPGGTVRQTIHCPRSFGDQTSEMRFYIPTNDPNVSVQTLTLSGNSAPITARFLVLKVHESGKP
jgi:hypothetical protein